MARVDAPRTRRRFARLENALGVPNLIDIQRRSFEWLVDTEKGGLRETIDDVSPIEDYTGNLAVVFEDITFDDPVASISECREKDLTYARPLTVRVAFQNRETGEIREQSVFMGDFPWMTDWGTFIINGTERVVVTQLVRSPGRLRDGAQGPREAGLRRQPDAGAGLLARARDRQEGQGLRPHRPQAQAAGHRAAACHGRHLRTAATCPRLEQDEQILELFDNSLYIRLTLEADTEVTKPRRAPSSSCSRSSARASRPRWTAPATC